MQMQNQLTEELTLRRDVDSNGIVRYYNSEGKIHRVHGPAVICPDGSEFWLQNGKHHRLDGPAIIWNDGRKYWYINGRCYTEKYFNCYPSVIVYAKSKQQ